MTTTTVTEREIREAVTMKEAIDAVRDGFIDLAGGMFEMPTRIALNDGQFLVMATRHRPTSSAMIKTLSVNFRRTPAITGIVVWSEAGRPDQLVADAGPVTALRTGAVVGVATDLLAAPQADRLTLIGAGGQAPDQVRAVHAVRPLRRLTVVDTDPRRARTLLQTLETELAGVDLDTATDADHAVSEADIVCCATPATQPLFQASALPARVHVNAIGAFRPTMRELPDDLLADSRVVIDELDAVLQESGEIIHALEAGAITQDSLAELGHALTGPPVPHGGRTVFKTVGVATQDWAVARLLADKFLH
ncbi:ornithine cyclodeaminase family protein [Streptomyces sp. MS06]|uniref:ornithine cyclodeaminase family protein n=1 Tax=Streptomyces sp. MS06 TaxID=3385974 RepID=UPI0039A2BC11